VIGAKHEKRGSEEDERDDYIVVKIKQENDKKRKIRERHSL
jgi:hypothetical protein